MGGIVTNCIRIEVLESKDKWVEVIPETCTDHMTYGVGDRDSWVMQFIRNVVEIIKTMGLKHIKWFNKNGKLKMIGINPDAGIRVEATLIKSSEAQQSPNLVGRTEKLLDKLNEAIKSGKVSNADALKDVVQHLSMVIEGAKTMCSNFKEAEQKYYDLKIDGLDEDTKSEIRYLFNRYWEECNYLKP